MANTKNSSIREMIIDRCLSDFKRYYSTKDMMELCNRVLEEEGYAIVTSPNTIRTDMDNISNRWKVGIVEIKQGRNKYYRYEEEGFSIYRSPLSESELTQLSQTLLVLSRFQGLPQFEWISELNARFKSTLMMNIDTRTVIAFEENLDAKGKEHIGPLFDAIIHRQPLELVYKRFTSSQSRSYVVHPYYLKQHGNRWYLLCGYHDYAHITTFALDRIISYQPLSIPYIENKKVDFTEYFDDVIGIFVEPHQQPEKVQLWVSSLQYPYVETKPLHGTQKVISREESGVVVQIEVQVNEELVSLILSLGEHMKVLSPPGLREEVKERLLLALSAYD